MNATAPLVVLQLTDDRLIFAMRPRWIARLFGARTLTLRPTDLDEAFPATGMLRSPGVGLKPRDGRVVYFWTRRRAEILAVLQTAHFPVSWEERRFSY